MPATVSAMSDTTLSPAPFSPFSSYSATSGATSDDAPDLGAFTTVFRELNTYHPRANALYLDDGDQSARTPTTFLLSDYDSEPQHGSTVWNQGPIADYLERSESEPSSLEDRDEPTDQPSLGLAGVFDFLAQERARLAALRLRDNNSGPARTAGHSSSATSDGTWRHVVQPRRRRRRRRDKRSQSLQVRRAAGDDEATAENDEDDDEEDSSSDAPPANYYESTPASPPPTARQEDRGSAEEEERAGRQVVHHTRSTPSLRVHPIVPIDPRVLQLRNLAHKLRMLYPRDAKHLSAILANDQPENPEFVDPRGPGPIPKDTLIHVFIDHSNILIGFLVYLRRHMHRLHRKSKNMSHAALALILERGRPVTRRVLATSSPLVQPIDSAEQLGYEVHVLQRVPDAGEVAERQHASSSTNSSSGDARPQPYRKGKGHIRGASSLGGAGGVSADSTSNSDSAGANGSVPSRRRFREQGVDELLQLKIHQALAGTDAAPPNATIVLATGDGNVGQFNEEGFLGCVRLALRKGWRVELYAWEGGLSKAWKKEFGNNKLFEIYMLDRFAMDLLEL